MKSTHWIALVLCGVVTGCAEPRRGGPHVMTRAVPEPCQILVQLDTATDDNEAQILVDYEPVRTKRCAASSNKKIVTWNIDEPSVNGYKFTSNGIEFPAWKNPHPASDFPTNCAASHNRRLFTCEFKAAGDGKRWAYIIRLEKANKPPKETDPTVVND